MIISFILLIVLLLIIPTIIGVSIIKYDKKNNENILFAFIIGILIEFMVFEIIAIPFCLFRFSFISLRNTWILSILIITTISIFYDKKILKEIIYKNIKKIKKFPKLLTISFLILLLFQVYMSFFYMYEDYDDSNFVAKATIARDTNTLFVYDDLGQKYNEFPTRHVFSPFPYFTATIGDIVGVHPAIVAHTIFPVYFLIVGYIVFYLIGLSLFNNDKNKTIVFMIILSILYIFGKYSRYAIFVRLLGRAWQGKSLLANIILPFIMYIFLEYVGEENDRFYWILLFITLWAGDLLSSMALFLPVIACSILVILYAIKDRKINYILKFILCCLPNLVYGIIFLFIK